MSWKEDCIFALDQGRMFENSEHRTRFIELMDCYSDAPFFTAGLCKCMYLSAWDEVHFCIMLEVLNDMSLAQDSDTKEMRIKGDAYEEEIQTAEQYVYKLSNAFLDDLPFDAKEPAELPDDIRYIVRRALIAAAVIDSV